jgi:hypothetical protein
MCACIDMLLFCRDISAAFYMVKGEDLQGWPSRRKPPYCTISSVRIELLLSAFSNSSCGSECLNIHVVACAYMCVATP